MKHFVSSQNLSCPPAPFAYLLNLDGSQGPLGPQFCMACALLCCEAAHWDYINFILQYFPDNKSLYLRTSTMHHPNKQNRFFNTLFYSLLTFCRMMRVKVRKEMIYILLPAALLLYKQRIL